MKNRLFPWISFITAPDDTGTSPDPEDVPEPDPEDANPDEPVDGEDALGDPGKRALEAIKAKHKAERTKRIAAESALRDATAPKGDAPDADAIRAEATREATARANLRVVRAEVKGAAASLFEDPADALAFLDLTTFDVDDDGDVDADDIDTALKELLAKKPHLAKTSTPQGGSKKRIPEVSADPARKTSTPLSHADRVAAAQAAGDHMAVISLQNELLAQQQ